MKTEYRNPRVNTWASIILYIQMEQTISFHGEINM